MLLPPDPRVNVAKLLSKKDFLSMRDIYAISNPPPSGNNGPLVKDLSLLPFMQVVPLFKRISFFLLGEGFFFSLRKFSFPQGKSFISLEILFSPHWKPPAAFPPNMWQPFFFLFQQRFFFLPFLAWDNPFPPPNLPPPPLQEGKSLSS